MEREWHLSIDDSTHQKLRTLAENYSNRHLFYKEPEIVTQELRQELSAALPERIHNAIHAMVTEDGPDLLSISNLPVDEDLPATNIELSQRVRDKTKISEYCLVGLSSLLQGWLQAEETSHQPGYIHQITPVKSYEQENSGRGRQGLPFHVENVFTKAPPSFLCLICIVGEKGVGTEYIYLEDIVRYLDSQTLETLKKPVYTISSGDGFQKKLLENSAVIEDMGNRWTLGRFYEEDRIWTEDKDGKIAVDALHDAIVKARDNDYHSVNLESGTMLLFRNGIGKGRFGGVMHGRRGVIGQNATPNGDRWLQRVCVEIPYL